MSFENLGDFRAAIARKGIKIYELAPLVRMNPARLGQILRGKLPLRPDLAKRLKSVLRGDL